MKRQFVTKDISLALREMGFDEECMAYIESPNPDKPILLGYTVRHSNFTKLIGDKRYRIAMPTWQQVLYWLRDEHAMYVDFWYSSHDKMVDAMTEAIELLKSSLVALEVYDYTDGSITGVTSDNPNKEIAIGKNARFMTKIYGKNWNDCMRKMHEYMGWEPYNPF